MLNVPQSLVKMMTMVDLLVPQDFALDLEVCGTVVEKYLISCNFLVVQRQRLPKKEHVLNVQ